MELCLNLQPQSSNQRVSSVNYKFTDLIALFELQIYPNISRFSVTFIKPLQLHFSSISMFRNPSINQSTNQSANQLPFPFRLSYLVDYYYIFIIIIIFLLIYSLVSLQSMLISFGLALLYFHRTLMSRTIAFELCLCVLLMFLLHCLVLFCAILSA